MVFWTILKYHLRYYCQIPLQVMLLPILTLNKSAVFAFSVRWEVKDICAWLTQNMLEENKVRGSTLLSSLKDGTLKTDLRIEIRTRNIFFFKLGLTTCYTLLITFCRRKTVNVNEQTPSCCIVVRLITYRL